MMRLPPLDHLLGCELRAEERALEVDRRHLVVLRLARVEYRGAGFDAGVVHHYVEPTEPLHRRIDEFLEVGRLAHVSRDSNGLVTELADLPLERLGRLRMDHIVDDDAGLLTRQLENDRLTDPAVAAGDDSNLVFQGHDQPLNNPCGIAWHSQA